MQERLLAIGGSFQLHPVPDAALWCAPGLFNRQRVPSRQWGRTGAKVYSYEAGETVHA